MSLSPKMQTSFINYFKADIEIKLFFLFLPFAYALQVLFFSKYMAVLPYIPLSFCIAKFIRDRVNRNIALERSAGSPAFIPVMLFMATILYSVAIEAYSGSLGGMFKILLSLFLPLFVFFLAADGIFEETVTFLFNLIIACAAVLALEELYEFLRTTPTIYEARNLLYIKAVTGELVERWGGETLRPGGLLDHVHAAPVFIGVGLLGSFFFYLHTSKTLYLLPIGVCVLGLVSSGMRLPVIATFFTLFVLALAQIKDILRASARVRRLIYPLVISVLVVFVLYRCTRDMTRDMTLFWDFYSHPISTGELIPGKGFVKDVVVPQASETWRNMSGKWTSILFGYGLSTTRAIEKNVISDDVFTMYVLGGAGILGTLIFYSLFAAAAYMFVKSVPGMDFERRHILLFPAGIVLILFISTFHSGIFIKRAIYPLFFLALGIAARYF